MEIRRKYYIKSVIIERAYERIYANKHINICNDY